MIFFLNIQYSGIVRLRNTQNYGPGQRGSLVNNFKMGLGKFNQPLTAKVLNVPRSVAEIHHILTPGKIEQPPDRLPGRT